MRTFFALITAAILFGSTSHANAANAIAHVESRGDGPINMILIPGSPCDWRVWDDFMTRNKDQYTMHALTLAGFSGTDPLPMPDETTTSPTPWFDAAVVAIATYITEHDLQGAVIVGHSLGGHIALRFGVEYPNLASAIIDIDGVPSSNFGGPDLSPEMRIAFVDSQLAPQLRGMGEQEAVAMQEQAARAMVTDPERGEELAGMFIETKYAIAIEYLIQGLKSNITEGLKAMEPRTLVIVAVGQAGDNNDARTQIRAQWVEWTNGAEAVTVNYFADSKHFVMDDQPEKLDTVIAEFLKSEPRP